MSVEIIGEVITQEGVETVFRVVEDGETKFIFSTKTKDRLSEAEIEALKEKVKEEYKKYKEKMKRHERKE